ncbi:MAG: polymer-forming cytoskeletal protein [Anaerolineae bacterium]
MSRQRLLIGIMLGLLLIALLAVPVAAQQEVPGKFVFGGTYTLANGQQLTGDLGVVGGVATIDKGALVTGDVMVAGGTLDVSGQINGDVAVFGGSVSLADSAVIQGDLVTYGGSIKRSEGATVLGDVSQGGASEFTLPSDVTAPDSLDQGYDQGYGYMQPDRPMTPGGWLLHMLWRLVRAGVMTLALAALAALVALLWPRGLEQLTKTTLQQPLVVFGVGLLSWIVGIGLVIVFAVTLCLLPLSLLLALVLLVAVLLSWVVAGLLVGRKLLAVLKVRNPSIVLEAALGTLLLMGAYFLIGIIPCTDFIFGTIVASIGLGAIVLTRFGTRPYPYAPATAMVQVDDLEAFPTVSDAPRQITDGK